MLKISVENGAVECASGGSFIEIAAEITYAIHRLWLSIGEADPELGNYFKRTVQAVIADDDSPVWELEEKK